MKSFIVLLFLIICSSCSFNSQETNKDGYLKFYNSYKNTEGILTFSIPSAFAGCFIERNSEEDVDELVDKLKKVNFLIVENADNKLLKDLDRSLSGSKYKDIMQVKDGASSVIFKIRESKEKADELVMFVKDNNDIVVMCVLGSFCMDDAKKLAKSIKVDEAVKTRQ